MKGLYQRGNVWWLRYTYGGRQLRESLKTENEAAAITLAKEILEQPDRQAARAWEHELTDYLNQRTAAGKMSANAASARKAVLMRFALERDVTHPSQVDPRMVEDWYRSQQRSIAEITAQTYVGWLKTFMGHLVDKRMLRTNPVAVDFDRAKKAKRRPFCTAEQVRSIMDAAETDEMRFILYCGFHAGLRRGEIVEARPEWFDLKEGLLHVQRSDTWETKDRDDRTIPLTAEFITFLSHYGLPSPFMLPGRKMSRARRWRYRYDFRKPFEDTVKRAGLPWVTPHAMRRTFASLLVSRGVSLYKVAIWLGDLERVVQDHYGSLIPKDADIEHVTGKEYLEKEAR